MQGTRFIAGFAVASLVALSGALASTAASEEQGGRQNQPATVQGPPPTRGNPHAVQEGKLDQILAQQQALLDRLEALEGTTTAAFGGLQESILDGIRASTLEIFEVIDGLELQCTTPDLLPLPQPGIPEPYGFCQFTDDGDLVVRVHNQGGAASGPSTTRVTFLGTSTVVSEQATPGLSPFGGSANLIFDMPESCFPTTGGDTQCHFTISVDHANVVGESNEANNTAAGICVRVG